MRLSKKRREASLLRKLAENTFRHDARHPELEWERDSKGGKRNWGELKRRMKSRLQGRNNTMRRMMTSR